MEGRARFRRCAYMQAGRGRIVRQCRRMADGTGIYCVTHMQFGPSRPYIMPEMRRMALIEEARARRPSRIPMIEEAPPPATRRKIQESRVPPSRHYQKDPKTGDVYEIICEGDVCRRVKVGRAPEDIDFY